MTCYSRSPRRRPNDPCPDGVLGLAIAEVLEHAVEHHPEELEQQEASLSQSTSALRASLSSIAAVTPTDAPLQADQTVTSVAYGAEYHVWPAAAAGAWMLLAQHTAALFG